MPKQFVACKFKTADSRTYTYHNEGEPLVEGDRVVALSRGSEKIITVVGVDLEEPDYATAPILRKHVPEPDTLADDADLLRRIG